MSRGRRLPKILSEEEQAALLATFRTRSPTPHRDKVMCQLMLHTGLRVGEVVALKVDHVECDAQGGKLVVRDGKGSKDRGPLYFGTEMRDALRGWLERDDRPESEFVFPTRKGTQVATSHLRRRVKRAARDAGIKEAERVSPHNLRHTFATDLYRATSNLRVVQEALGHESVQTTQVYAHLANGEVEESMRTLRSDPDPESQDEGGETDLTELIECADPDVLRAALQEAVT